MPVTCLECDWADGEPDDTLAGYLGTWHIYEEHPATWARVAGDRPPRDPDVRIPAVRERLLKARAAGRAGLN